MDESASAENAWPDILCSFLCFDVADWPCLVIKA